MSYLSVVAVAWVSVRARSLSCCKSESRADQKTRRPKDTAPLQSQNSAIFVSRLHDHQHMLSFCGACFPSKFKLALSIGPCVRRMERWSSMAVLLVVHAAACVWGTGDPGLKDWMFSASGRMSQLPQREADLAKQPPLCVLGGVSLPFKSIDRNIMTVDHRQ